MDEASCPSQSKAMIGAERNRSRRSAKASESVECEVCKKTFANSAGTFIEVNLALGCLRRGFKENAVRTLAL